MGLFSLLKRVKKNWDEVDAEMEARHQKILEDKRKKEEKDFYAPKVASLLKQANEAAEIINTTTVAKTFWGRLHFLFDVLLELQKYEHYGFFVNSTPTQDYNKLINNLEATVDDFIDRVIIAHTEKYEHLESQKEKDKKLEKLLSNLWNSFYESSDYWSGNHIFPHYEGKLYTDTNFQRIEDMLNDLQLKRINNKIQEYESNGITHKSSKKILRDQEYQRGQEERKAKEESRKKQCDSFTVDDMQKFPDIPIAWIYIMQLFHTDGIAWCQLNWNNQQIVLQYISQINDIIVNAHSYVDEIGDAQIDLYSMDFDYPVPMYKNCMCNTRIECYPYTATGKLSKYPVIIKFATKFNDEGLRTIGEIKILRDGNIGSATVHIHGNTFKIGLHGTSLVLQRVDNPYLGGNLFRFSETYE